MSIIDMFKAYRERSSQRPFNNFTEQEHLRIALYRTYYEMYAGKHWDVERKDGEEQITANMCNAFVDKNAVFLFGKGWEISGSGSSASKVAISFLEEVWQRNSKDLFGYELGHGGSLFGDYFILVHGDAMNRPKASLIAPMYVKPYFDPNDKYRMLSAEIQYSVHTSASSQPVVVVILVDSQKIVEYRDGKKFAEREHRLGQCPVVHVRNLPVPATVYGRSDLYNIVELQKTYNKVMTDLTDIVAYHASPVTLAYGVRINQMEKGAQRMYAGLPYESKIENLEMKGDIDSSLKHAKEIKRLMHQLGSTPEVAFGSVEELRFSNSSAVALQLLFQPLLDTKKVKTFTYGTALAKVNELLLRWGEVNLQLVVPRNEEARLDFYTTHITFPDPLPRDANQELINLTLQMDRKLITFEDALRVQGHRDPETYAQRIIDEYESGRNAYLAYGEKSAEQNAVETDPMQQ